MEILSITHGEMSMHMSNMDIHFGVNKMLVKISNLYTLGYQFDPSIRWNFRWNIVVSRFHLIDRF